MDIKLKFHTSCVRGGLTGFSYEAWRWGKFIHCYSRDQAGTAEDIQALALREILSTQDEPVRIYTDSEFIRDKVKAQLGKLEKKAADPFDEFLRQQMFKRNVTVAYSPQELPVAKNATIIIRRGGNGVQIRL